MSPVRIPMRVPTPANVRFKRALRILDAHVARIITDRRAAKERPHDLLSMFLEVRDADTGEGMSDHHIRDEVMTLVLAGHETTANALSWAFHLLSTHPEVEAKLRAELESVLGGRTPAFEDLPKLTYTLNVFQEAMRLYPPVWMIERTNKAPDVLAGVPIPARSIVTLSPYAAHHNPRVWDNPEAFDPDRFLPERSKDRPRFAYMPFGGGPRLCIGNNFALMEAQLILAMVLQKHRVQLDPTGVVEPALVLTLRPRFGLTMTLKTLKPPRGATALGRPHVV
jgi:cytochrome P450